MREIAAVITRIAGASLLGPRKLLSEVLAATSPITPLAGTVSGALDITLLAI